MGHITSKLLKLNPWVQNLLEHCNNFEKYVDGKRFNCPTKSADHPLEQCDQAKVQSFSVAPLLTEVDDLLDELLPTNIRRGNMLMKNMFHDKQNTCEMLSGNWGCIVIHI
jgi:hypothetical protein